MRPNTFTEFIGQQSAVMQLSIAIRAAQDRQSYLDHLLLTGPAGTGKTTLAKLTAGAFAAKLIDTTAQTLTSPTELTNILCSLRDGEFLFIDEVHRLPIACQEALYRAMEDRYASITVGKGEDVKVIPVPLARFVLIGATNRPGMLSKPFLDRFTHQVALEFYKPEELAQILERAEPLLGTPMEPDARMLLASISRETPRVALQLLTKLRDFVQLSKAEIADKSLVLQACQVLGIGPKGLNNQEITLLKTLVFTMKGKPAGLAVLAATLGTEPDSIEESEEFLLRLGMINRTGQGRVATAAAYEYLGAQQLRGAA